MRIFTMITVIVLILSSLSGRLAAQVLPNHFEGSDTSSQAGGTFTLKYTNDAKAGETVTIVIKDSLDTSRTKIIELKVGDDGKFETEVDVPSGWLGVLLTAPGSSDWVVDVVTTVQTTVQTSVQSRSAVRIVDSRLSITTAALALVSPSASSLI